MNNLRLNYKILSNTNKTIHNNIFRYYFRIIFIATLIITIRAKIFNNQLSTKSAHIYLSFANRTL